MKDHVKILLVGDEGVGKSSLISAYISQHFPQEVPPVMIDAIIPPEAVANEVCVTIMDSSASPGDREVLKQKIMAADSIISLYDVTRPETFESMTTFWLPLICELSGEHVKPVILVGTKTDLLMQEQDLQQLNSLLLAFPFVMNSCTCSAVNIENIDTVFRLAELFVNYPLSYIMDVTVEEFTPAARRAFQRVFRIFDLDGDNLLCDAEFSDTQLRCFDDRINTMELLNLKRQIMSEVPDSVVNNCVTFEGFLGLIKMNLKAHQYQIPWLILRRFSYDDNLNITLPEAITTPPALRADQVTELSPSARGFLLNLAQIAYSECEHPVRPESDNSSEVADCLTWDALRIVLSVLSGDAEEDPWSDPPAFKTSWRYDDSVEQRILLKGLSHVGATLTFEDWVAHWSLFAANDPVATQVLLFKLGYVERADLGITASSGPMQSVLAQALAASAKPSFFSALFLPAKVPAPAPRSVLQVCVLGDNGVGKSSFVWSLTGLRAPGLGGDVEMGVEYSKFSEAIVVGGCALRHGSETAVSLATGGASRHGKGRGGGSGDAAATLAQLSLLREVLTEHCELSIAAVPLDQAESWLEHCIHSCDLAVLMFQSANATSLKTAIALDARLPATVPRLFVASKADTIPSAQVLSLGAHSPTQRGEFGNQTRSSREALKAAHESVLQEASLHIQARGLPPLALLSTLTGDGVTEAYHQIVDVATDPTKGIPRKATKSKSGFGISTPVVVATTVVVGVASLALLARYNKSVRDWLDSMFLSTRTFLLGAAP